MTAASVSRPNLDLARFLGHHRLMLRIRAFETAAGAALGRGLASGAVHLSIGQEAVAAAFCGNLERGDYMLSTHRGHGHSIAKGADPAAMMRELFGRQGGTSGGKGGSMHIADFQVRMLGANGVVAANIPIAVGAAHAVKRRGGGEIVVCMFGDGAVNRGPFLEGLNWARVFDLPVLFVCEDNRFSATTRTSRLTGGAGPMARAAALGLPACEVDGNDIAAADALARDEIAMVRRGEGPRFVLARTYRLAGHTVADTAPYRDSAEVEEWRARDPLTRSAELLTAHGVAATELESMAAAAEAEIRAAAAEAEAAPWPEPEQAFRDVQDIGGPAWPS